MECQLFTKSLISFPTSDILFICIVVDIIIMRDGQITDGVKSELVSQWPIHPVHRTLSISYTGQCAYCAFHLIANEMTLVVNNHWLFSARNHLRSCIYFVQYMLSSVQCSSNYWVALCSVQCVPLGCIVIGVTIYRVTSHGVAAVNGDYRSGISREIRKYGNNLRTNTITWAHANTLSHRQCARC